jgi:hypothetical protein
MLQSELSSANLRGDFVTVGSDLSPHGGVLCEALDSEIDVMTYPSTDKLCVISLSVFN